MFTNTAYEALYEYLGLYLHSKSIEIITSQKIFGAAILLVFGYLFFATCVHFFSRYIPGVLIQRRSVPLSRFIKIIACLILGTSLLRVGATGQVKDFKDGEWSSNPYVKEKFSSVQSTYRVSFVFDVLSRSAEEVSSLLSQMVDKLFVVTNSQLKAPDFFFKAIMYAGSSSLQDPALKENVRLYTDECFDKVLPLIKEADSKLGLTSKFYSKDPEIDTRLSQIIVEETPNIQVTCLDLKLEILGQLKAEALKNSGALTGSLKGFLNSEALNSQSMTNLAISESLVDHYLTQHEAAMGVQSGSQIPTASGRFYQYVVRFFSIDGWMPGSQQGAFVTAKRSQEFSENLARAPHVAGFIKMIAILIFPWLVFPIVAGYWRALFYWCLIYFSVLLWAPIWTLLYHIMSGIALSAEVMQSFKSLQDGISLYSAQLISARVYHLYAVYSWLQILTGTLFTGGLLWAIRPAMMDTQGNQVSEITDGASRAVSLGSKVAGAL
jgi:hypothetical protein